MIERMTPPEYVALNGPDDLSYNHEAEAALNFLSATALGEPYALPPRPDEPAPLLYGAIEDGHLIAAASVGERYQQPGEYAIETIGVAPEYRSQGVGSELLRRVEQAVAEFGAQTLVVNPIDIEYPPDSREELSPANFFYHRGYTTERTDRLGRPEFLVKELTDPALSTPPDEIQ